MGVRMHPFFFLSQERVHAGAPFLWLNPSRFFQPRGILTGLFLTEARLIRTSIRGFMIHDLLPGFNLIDYAPIRIHF